ncbi:hypothetical protein QLS71_003700 [Mariniflexile litorale]|uniref:Uncharacterized protein n=1 Tax=Mariniflexile litorale TaxID=3045158 RepID=A0AAU7EJD1_9FLAO|nr:hypothetical protein [Mariniflexile sp. KMM 9835]MDQ8210124.1 hypothetical protein [Mariniflexile sp. KMM 9835]
MKKLIISFIILIISISCKKKEENKGIETELSTAEKIANAHGFENWKNVSKIAFNFNQKRSWEWNPKTNVITLITDNDTIVYNRKSIDSISENADKGFINDKFWLLIPFQLVWDIGKTISEPVKTEAPISKIEMNKITLLYSNEEGYTPGDAYDIYYSDDYIIKEWAFRKGNKLEAGLVNTFENYQDFNGIKIALDHKKAEGDWNLKFTDVKVTLE